jgi:hypothetical protein
MDRWRPLDSGRRDSSPVAALTKLGTDSAFAHVRSKFGGTQLADTDMAACCVSGVWLLHDCLDESHAISQGIDTSSNVTQAVYTRELQLDGRRLLTDTDQNVRASFPQTAFGG